MNNVMELCDSFANLTSLQAKELRLLLKDKFGIEAPGGDAIIPKQEEIRIIEPVITDYNVMYEGFDLAKKIGLIKVIREIMALSLGDAKNFVEGGVKPIKENIGKNLADELKKKLEEAGAKISLVPA